MKPTGQSRDISSQTSPITPRRQTEAPNPVGQGPVGAALPPAGCSLKAPQITICSVSAVICAICKQGGSFPTLLQACPAVGEAGGLSEPTQPRGKVMGKWALRLEPCLVYPPKSSRPLLIDPRTSTHVKQFCHKKALCSNKISPFPKERILLGTQHLLMTLYLTKPGGVPPMGWGRGQHPNTVRKTQRHHSHNSFPCSVCS